jgi:hypothetical protein
LQFQTGQNLQDIVSHAVNSLIVMKKVIFTKTNALTAINVEMDGKADDINHSKLRNMSKRPETLIGRK